MSFLFGGSKTTVNNPVQDQLKINPDLPTYKPGDPLKPGDRYIFDEGNPGPPPDPAAGLAPPDLSNPEVQADLNNAAAEQTRKARGRAATIFTGGTGLLDSAKVTRKTLLGY